MSLVTRHFPNEFLRVNNFSRIILEISLTPFRQTAHMAARISQMRLFHLPSSNFHLRFAAVAAAILAMALPPAASAYEFQDSLLLERDGAFMSGPAWFSSGPSWLMKSMPGANFRFRPYVIDRSGDPEESTAQNAYVGTLANPFNVMLFNNVAAFGGGGGTSKVTRPFQADATPPDYYWDVNGSLSGFGGTGTWDVGITANWNDATGTAAPFVWADGNNAIFSGTAGTVTLGGAVSAIGLVFSTSGYTITGSSAITLTGTPSIDTSGTGSGGLTIIDAPLAGTVGFTKSGAGTLELRKAVTISAGTISVTGGTLRIGNPSNTSSDPHAFLNGRALSVSDATFEVDANANAGSTFALANLSSLTFSGNSTFTLRRTSAANGSSQTADFTAVPATFSGTVNFKLDGSFSSGANGTWQVGKTGTGAAGITLAGNTLFNASSGTIPNGNGAGNSYSTQIRLEGLISESGGARSITANTGILRLTATTNTFSGGVFVNSGAILEVGGNSNTITSGSVSAGSLGKGTLTLNDGATIRSSAATTSGDRSIANNLSFNGVVTLGDTSNTGVLTFDNSALTTKSAALTADTTLKTLSAVTIVDVISGNFKLTKDGASTLTLSGINSYGGGTTITSGTLKLSGSGTLGSTSGTLAVNGGTLDLNGTTQGVGNFTGSGGTVLNNGTGTNVTLTVGNGNSTGGNYQGTIADNTSGTGTVALTKTGTGAITLSGTNSYSGATLINAGTLTITNGSALGSTTNGTTVSSGAVLALDGTAGVFTVGNETLHINGAGLTASPAGALRNITGSNVFGGAITLDGASTITASDGTLTLTGGITNGGFLLTFDSPSDITVSSNKITGAGGLTKSGAGWLRLSAANDYSGGTTISGGTVQLSGAGTLGSTTGSVALNSGVLDLNGTSQTFGAFSGTGSSAQVINSSSTASTLTIGNGGGSGTFAGAITNTGLKTINVIKTGGGTETLTNNNSYLGSTTINGGTLELKNPGGVALSGTSGVQINNGGTLLFSADNQLNQASAPPITLGTIGGTGTAPKIDAGNTSQGGPNAGGTAGLGALTLNVNSTISLTGNNSVLHFADSNSQTWQPSAILSITNWNGIPTTGGGTEQLLFGNGNVPGLSLGQLGQIQFIDPAGFAPGTYSAIFATLDPNEIVPGAAVPEPSTWIGAALALAAIGWTQRRRLSRVFRRA